MLDVVREMYAYTRWANDRALDAAARLAPAQLTRKVGGSFGSIFDTLVHVASADWIWLRRWHGEPAPALPADWHFDDLAGLRERWEETIAERAEFIDALEEMDLARPLPFITRKGDALELSLGQTLLHVANHSTYHRGQVATLTRQVGGEPVGTDMTLFQREWNAGRAR